MNFSRRNFFKLSGAAALGAAGLSRLALGQSASSEVLDGLSADSFRQLIGDDFHIYDESGQTQAMLAKVGEFSSETKGGECFSLVFETKSEDVRAGTYSVFNPKIGTLELFMTDGKSGRNGALIAIINRI